MRGDFDEYGINLQLSLNITVQSPIISFLFKAPVVRSLFYFVAFRVANNLNESFITPRKKDGE